LRRSLFLLVLANVLAVVALYILGLLFIETLFALWNVSVIVAIVLWDREAAKNDPQVETFSAEERWSKAKARLESIERRLKKDMPESEFTALKKERNWLTVELRRLEWSLKESDLTSLTLASMGKVKQLERQDGLAGRRGGSVSEKDGLKELDRLIGAAVDAVNHEPEESIPFALKPLINRVNADFNQIKKTDRNSALLQDYWAVWATLSCRYHDQTLDPRIIEYSREEAKEKIERLFQGLERKDLR